MIFDQKFVDVLPHTRMRSLLFLVMVGCGSSSTNTTTTDAGTTLPVTDDPLQSGTCSFTLDGQSYSLRGYAALNGSGNLEVRCGDTEKIALDVGNGSYEGPGTYTFSDDLHEGHLEIDLGETKIESGQCTVTITTAPIGSTPARGSSIAGTFTCPKLHGATALTNGAFNLIRQ